MTDHAQYEAVARLLGWSLNPGGNWSWDGKTGNPDWDTADTAKLAIESSGVHLDYVPRIVALGDALRAIIDQESSWDDDIDNDCNDDLWKQGYSEAVGEAASKAKTAIAKSEGAA